MDKFFSCILLFGVSVSTYCIRVVLSYFSRLFGMDRGFTCRWCEYLFIRKVSRDNHQSSCVSSEKFSKREVNMFGMSSALDVADLCSQLSGLGIIRTIVKNGVEEDCKDKCLGFTCEVCGAVLVQFFGCKNLSCNLK